MRLQMRGSTGFWRVGTWGLVGLSLLTLLSGDPCAAQVRRRTRSSSRAVTAPAPRDYRSKNFLVHTDLPAEQARSLLARLENMLRLISRYWARPNTRVIECYVVDDLEHWPEGVISGEGLEAIRRGAGVTVSRVLSQGRRFQAKAVVYAVAEGGAAQHEAVHAYCTHAFGRTGPVWYSEGMAEMGNYWQDDNSSVNCYPTVARYLRESEPKSLREIVAAPALTGDSWQNYAWRWALCHLLANNPNYADRFRPLGLGLLTNKPVSFETMYGAMAREISFEYLFFLKHVDVGYRVDLCSWDWKTRYRRPRGTTTATIEARGGWQPSSVLVKSGDQLSITASGTWQIAAESDLLTADGDASGSGQLVGIIFDNDEYELGEEFEIGADSTLSVDADGQLLLRCRDEWSQLDDNSGKLTVKFQLQ